MRMIEPQEILMRAAIEALKPYGTELRNRGWNTGLSVNEDGALGGLLVCLEIRIRIPIPTEVPA